MTETLLATTLDTIAKERGDFVRWEYTAANPEPRWVLIDP